MSRALPIRIAIILAVAVPALGAAAASALTASAVASRTSGVAPLAVFFDGRGSSDTGVNSDSAFVDFNYSWNFGDTPCSQRGDVWKYSGKSKCTDMGPLAGHVYETPGTYTATLTVRNGGRSATKNVTITVQDPNQVFSGSSTTCISTTSDFSGCPAGATHVTSTADFSKILGTYLRSGTRVLFHRGQRWSDNANYKYTLAGPSMIGAFGTGGKPVISLASVRMFTFTTGSKNLTIMDLEVAGNNATTGTIVISTGATGVNDQTANLLVFRVDIHNVSSAIGPSTLGGTPGTSAINNNLSFVENTSQQKTSNSGNYDFFGGAERLLFMGNNFGNEQGLGHDVRVIYTNGAVISHNYLGPLASSIQSLLKVHSEDNLVGSPCTQAIEVADNTFDAGAAEVSASFGPQDRQHVNECVKLVRIERNFFSMAGDSMGVRSLWLAQGPDLVADNIFDLSSTRASVNATGLTLWVNGNAPTTNNRIYNNSCYSSAPPGTVPSRCIQLQSGTTNSVVRNNVIYSTQSGTVVLNDQSGSGTIQSNNLTVSSSPYVKATPTMPQDYKLPPSSPAVNAGSNTVPTAGADFSGVPGSRLSGSSIDVGAWELGSGSVPASGGPPSAPVLLP